MKTTAISFAILMMSAMTFGQTNPQFQATGGQASTSIYNYVLEQINCPGENTSCFLPGTEVVSFTVTSTGELTDFRVVSSVSRNMDEEMIRVLKGTTGSWQPGRANGEPADMEYEVALTFILSNFDPVQEATKSLSKGNSLIYKNPKRALRYINDAFRLFPSSESVLVARSLCKAEPGDAQGALEDSKRIIALKTRGDKQHSASDAQILAENLSGNEK